MSLKRSCFKTIVKCDLKRSWWIGALATIFIFMTFTTQLFVNNIRYNLNPNHVRYVDALDYAQNMFGTYLIGMFLSIFVVLYLFAYINKVNSVSFFHSLPATRNTLFFAHLTSAMILVVGPMLINSFLSIFAIGLGVRPSYILVSLGMYLIYSLVIMGLSLTIVMLTGVSLASGAFTFVIIFLPLYFVTFVYELCNQYLYGFTDFDVMFDFLIGFVYLSPNSLMSFRVLIYIVLIAVFFGLALFLYKKRHLENFGEVIAFPELKNFFKVLFALCCAITGYYYFAICWDIHNIFTMVIFGALGAIIANMIANKSLTFRGCLKPILIMIGIVMLLFVVFFFDLFCFETRIPDAEDIEYAELGDNYYFDNYSIYMEDTIYGEIEVQKKNPNRLQFKSDKEKQYFIDIHRRAVENKDEYEELERTYENDYFGIDYDGESLDTLEIIYTLNNGKQMRRLYTLPESVIDEMTTHLYDTDAYRAYMNPILKDDEVVYDTVYVDDKRTYFYGDKVSIPAQKQEARRLIDAIKKDRENISVVRMKAEDEDTLIEITLSYKEPYINLNNNEEIMYSNEYTYYISKSDVNTWAVLEELNLFEDKQMLTVDDVSKVNVCTYKFDDVEKIIENGTYSYDYLDSRTFVSKKEISELFNLYMTLDNDYDSKNHKAALVDIEIEFVEVEDENLYESDDTAFSHEVSRSRRLIIPEDKLPESLLYVKNLQVK